MNLNKEKIRNLANKYGFQFGESGNSYWIKGKSESNGKKIKMHFSPTNIRFIYINGFFSMSNWWQIKENVNITEADIDNLIRFLSTSESKRINFDEIFPHLKISRWDSRYEKKGNLAGFSSKKKWSELSTFEKVIKIGFLIFWLGVVIWGLI